MFSKIDDEVKINEPFVGFKTDQHEIRIKISFNVNILTNLIFTPLHFDFKKTSLT